MTTSSLVLVAVLTLLSVLAATAVGDPEEREGSSGRIAMDADQASKFAGIALGGITREYPNKPGNVLASDDDVKSPRDMHPAFYGCFDWHSAVHGHWMLVRLLKRFPKDLAEREKIVAALNGNLTRENLAKEAAYFTPKWNRLFERTYGWAWLLCLARELRTWDHELGRTWAANLRPLEDRLVEMMKAYLPKLKIPIRSGEHRDTAFALSFTIDYARAVRDAELEALCAERARTYYAQDRDYPVAYEPSGHDFFSSGLNEADLMRRVLPAPQYSTWLDSFLPGLRKRDVAGVATPASVSDVTDGKLVHLAGLNLTRAWTLNGIASALPGDDPRRAYCREIAAAHTKAGVDYVFTGHYAGEHWLASFAVYLLTDANL